MGFTYVSYYLNYRGARITSLIKLHMTEFGLVDLLYASNLFRLVKTFS